MVHQELVKHRYAGPTLRKQPSDCRTSKLLVRIGIVDEADSDRYTETKLVEINSHSLFSKWFSESGKLVQKLFSHVTRMVDSESTFVVVMIGEFGYRVPGYDCLLTDQMRSRVLLVLGRQVAQSPEMPSEWVQTDILTDRNITDQLNRWSMPY